MKTAFVALLGATVGFCQSAKERALGQALATEIERRETVVHDPGIVNPIERLVSRLSSQCFNNTSIETHVVVSTEPNGHVLPGAVLFLNTGLIRETENEAEFAAVLAQLIARVVPGAPADKRPMMFLGGRSGYSCRQSQRALAAIPLAFADEQRAAVSAADIRAVECISSAGYDPEAFLTNLKRTETPRGPQPFSTHPATAERVESVQARIDQIPPGAQYILNTDTFDELKQRVDKLYPAPHAKEPAPPTLRRADLP